MPQLAANLMINKKNADYALNIKNNIYNDDVFSRSLSYRLQCCLVSCEKFDTTTHWLHMNYFWFLHSFSDIIINPKCRKTQTKNHYTDNKTIPIQTNKNINI